MRARAGPRAPVPRPGAGTGPPPGSAVSSPARFDSRTEQPVITTRIPGLAALSRPRCPCRPITFASAFSRMAQVLMTTRSAASIDGATGQPAASRRPAISSESLLFIWQPSVQTKNDGTDRGSGRNSVSRSSSGASGSRGVAADATGGTMSRTGRRRDVMSPVMVVPVGHGSGTGPAADATVRAWNGSRTPKPGSPC